MSRSYQLRLQRWVGPIPDPETRDVMEWRREDQLRAEAQVRCLADRVERGDVECGWQQEPFDNADIYVLWIERGQRSYDG